MAVMVSLTLLRTTPSGGLWMVSAMMAAVGRHMSSGGSRQPATP